jgi:folate-binding protein YgfZ
VTGEALSARIEAAATAFAEYDGARVPSDFGDVGAEYRALTEGTALVALPQRRRIRVEGSERADYLHGQLTSDVAALSAGQGQAALMLTAQGRVESMFALYDHGQSMEIVCDAGQLSATLERAGRFLVADDVELETADTDADSISFALIGPQSHELLKKLGVPSQAIKVGWYCAQFELFGSPVAVYGRADLKVPVFELQCTDPDRVWATSLELGAVPAGTSALEIVRVESGTARFGVDVDASRIALEARLEWAIHFSKGCYVGQEIIERAVTRGRLNRQLALLSCASGVVVGASLDGENEKCVVTSVVSSPVSGPLCLAYLPVERVEVGAEISIDGHAAKVLPWPRETVYAGRGS